jgi:hypothetical protein
MRYLTNCVSLSMGDVPDIDAMIEGARQIGYRTARHAIGHNALAEVFPDYDWRQRPRDLTMKRDWHVGYYRSTFRGVRCVYVKHSAIEYIFVEA